MTNFKTELTEHYKKYKKPAIERRRKWALSLLGEKCAKCGSTGSLEFDHIDPDSMEFRIGSNLLARKDRLEVELKKCQLLCRICHVNKTRSEIKARSIVRSTVHGTLTAYGKRRCRCTKCRQAWNAHYRAYIQKRRSKLI